MVAVSKGDTILVSGASGYISAHTVDQLLKAGYKAKGTVRDDNKGKYLKDLFKGKGDFEYVLVKDIGQVSLKKHTDCFYLKLRFTANYDF